MKRHYIHPDTSVCAIQSTCFTMQTLSSNLNLNNSHSKEDPVNAF